MKRSTTEAVSHNEYMKRLHANRRAAGLCINGLEHGPVFRGGRCKPCWTQKLDAERRAYADRKWGGA